MNATTNHVECQSQTLYPPPSNSEDVDKLKKNDDCFPNCIERCPPPRYIHVCVGKERQSQ